MTTKLCPFQLTVNSLLCVLTHLFQLVRFTGTIETYTDACRQKYTWLGVYQ